MKKRIGSPRMERVPTDILAAPNPLLKFEKGSVESSL
jgi:hypothetical protein